MVAAARFDAPSGWSSRRLKKARHPADLVEVISEGFLRGCAVLAVGSVGLWWATHRDLGSARRHPTKWNVDLQERLTALSGWLVVAAVGVFAVAGALYLVQLA